MHSQNTLLLLLYFYNKLVTVQVLKNIFSDKTEQAAHSAFIKAETFLSQNHPLVSEKALQLLLLNFLQKPDSILSSMLNNCLKYGERHITKFYKQMKI